MGVGEPEVGELVRLEVWLLTPRQPDRVRKHPAEAERRRETRLGPAEPSARGEKERDDLGTDVVAVVVRRGQGQRGPR